MLIFQNAKIKIEIEQDTDVCFDLKINGEFVTGLNSWQIQDISLKLKKLYDYNGIEELIILWMTKQGHDRCWYYPEIFEAIADKLGIKVEIPKQLPPQEEFDKGCKRYQLEEYKK